MTTTTPTPAPRAMCRHCHQYHVNRPRGLCWRCFYTPGVKERYQITSKFARRGIGNGFKPSTLPEPVPHIEPGSPEKLSLLAARAARGLSLFHPAEPRLVPVQPAVLPSYKRDPRVNLAEETIRYDTRTLFGVFHYSDQC